ncbi:bacterial hemoglobin [Aspergillus eucalypticola CBS 122712]|uniref:nitric oxide dioxygenase n=1 Tax=Aspergillus eucalypticola (strain CBS 122712 / IBT 29274) TaxID=1448314 RepID=A0A317W0V5_ASPEC|nr:bacterial hemoglobin [Aspergillus eucalypticola CBS 122712]PWY77780.1 bacterial hemoglobin [Aspergillus eucalypticola CBS 122712]
MGLTQEQTDIIKATVPVIKVHGNAVTSVFYKNMLAAHPELNAIFNSSNQVNGHQPRALAGAVFAYAANIDNLGALGPAVELICNKHASLYIQPEHYNIVGKFLLEAMGEVLGDAFTPAIKDAWAAAYFQLADIMINREAALYKEADGWTEFRDFRIAKKVPESSEITSFYLEPVDGKPLPSFRPGQYISIQLFVPQLNHPQARQYSLSDKPRSDYYRISVKKEAGLNATEPGAEAHPGLMSNILHDLKKEGDIIKVSHPQGDFFLSDAEKQSSSPIVLLAAGVGLTPLTSILNTILETESETQRKISFIHGARTSAARAFKPQIRELATKVPNLQAFFFTSHPAAEDKQSEDYDFAGRLDLSKLDSKKDLFLDDATTQYYVCGPESFMLDVKGKLAAEGVSADRIKMELFGTGGVPA